MLSHRRPDRLLREPGLFEPTSTHGIWVRRPIDLGAMFLVAATHLPEDPRYDWLRISTRIPDTAKTFRMADTLMRKQELARMKQAELEELIMEFIIDGKTPIEMKADLKKEQLLRMAAEEQRQVMEEQLRLDLEQRQVMEEQLRLDLEQRQVMEEQLRLAREQREEADREIQELKAQLERLLQQK